MQPKKLLPLMWNSGKDADTLIDEQGLRQVNDDTQIQVWVNEVIAANPDQVAAYRGGQQKMLGFFVGQVLKRSQGQANPKVVNALLRQYLAAE